MKIPFATQSYKDATLPLSAQQTVNFYAESAPPDARTQVAVKGCPGIITAATLGAGPVRQLHVFDGTLYAVSGGTLYSIDSDHIATPLGGVIGGSSVVSMDDNGSEIVVVNGTSGYIWDSTSGFRIISDADFNAANTVAHIDQFFLFDNAGTGEIFRSDLLDGTSYDAAAFATAESKSDDVLAVRNHKNILYALGGKTIEPMANTKAANFPFQRIEGALINRGIIGSFGITDEDEALHFIGDDRVAYRYSGSLKRASTHAIEGEWQRYGTVTDVIAFSMTFAGHKWVYFTFPTESRTFGYDLSTRLWHERKSHDRMRNDLGRWRVNCVATAYNRTYVGDVFSGKVGYLDADTYTEFGDQIIGELVSPPLFDRNGRRMSMPWFELDIETGVGLTSGQGSDPQIMMSISDNGGHSFEPQEIWRSMGKLGEYATPAYQLRWDRLGNFFNRCIKVTVSDPVSRTVLGARAPGLSAR